MENIYLSDNRLCINCRYWKEPNNKMGECLKTINGWESGIGTMSDSGWEGGMYTGPYFGCIHFEKGENHDRNLSVVSQAKHTH